MNKHPSSVFPVDVGRYIFHFRCLTCGHRWTAKNHGMREGLPVYWTPLGDCPECPKTQIMPFAPTILEEIEDAKNE